MLLPGALLFICLLHGSSEFPWLVLAWAWFGGTLVTFRSKMAEGVLRVQA